MSEEQTLMLHAKMLGERMRQARLANGKSLRETARALGISSNTLSSYELGRRAISLPDLELFAYHIGTPLSSLLSGRSRTSSKKQQFNQEMMRTLRNRVIGASLRAHRKEAGKTIRQLAVEVKMPSSRISAYERGERAIPIPHLAVIAASLGHQIEDYCDNEGPVGEWEIGRQAYDLVMDMPIELRQFLSQPSSLPFLELAKRLSELPAERLRAIAEGLLDITL
ncbi:MAG: helix-turn-helix domain-containing protein [Anaerolineales bacterium]